MHFVRVVLVFLSVVLVSLLTACGSGSGGSSNTSSTAEDLVLLAAGNNVTVLDVNSTTGAAFANVSSVTGAGVPASIVVTPQNLVYVSDFASDSIYGYSLNTSTGVLTALPGSPFSTGTGMPSGGVAIDPAGKFLYVTESNLNQVAGFSISASGQLVAIAGTPVPTGIFPIAAAVNPSGKYLYVANNSDPTGGVSGYAIDALGGLTQAPGSPFPTGTGLGRRLIIHPNGFLYVSSRLTGQIIGDGIAVSTGTLTPLSGSPFLAGSGPIGLAFDPSAHFLYVANYGGTFSAYNVDFASGALTPTAGSPFAADSSAYSVAVNTSGTLLYVLGSATLSVYKIDSSTGVPIPAAPPIMTKSLNGGLAVVSKQ